VKDSIEGMVREFHEKYGHLISDNPTTDIPENVKELRNKLIHEEITELRDAMSEDNIVEIADGIADAIYVLVGTAVSYGIPIDRVFREVHASNMTKTAIKAEFGSKYGTKTPKGPGYIAPDIHAILYEEQPTFLERLHDGHIEA
jgi:predicted HAD superfamily Cof-like phosphohydrolase